MPGKGGSYFGGAFVRSSADLRRFIAEPGLLAPPGVCVPSLEVLPQKNPLKPAAGVGGGRAHSAPGVNTPRGAPKSPREAETPGVGRSILLGAGSLDRIVSSWGFADTFSSPLMVVLELYSATRGVAKPEPEAEEVSALGVGDERFIIDCETWV